MDYLRDFKPKSKPVINNALADLHNFNGIAKLIVEIDFNIAKQLTDSAVNGGGAVTVQMTHNGQVFSGKLTEARLDTYNPNNPAAKILLSKKGQPGLCAFSALTKAKP